MSELKLETGTSLDKADIDNNKILSKAEVELYLDSRRKEVEDQDAMRDAQRRMAWFALAGMLLYPFAVVLATFLKLDNAANILGSMAATYFVSVAAIVAAFYGKEAFISAKKG